MRLTNESIGRFRNGRIIISKEKENCTCRGEKFFPNITTSGNLEIKFELRAIWWKDGKGKGSPDIPKEWIFIDNQYRNYTIDLRGYTSENVDPNSGEIGLNEDGNFTLASLDGNETIILYPPTS